MIEHQLIAESYSGPAVPPRYHGRFSALQFLGAMRRNTLSAWPEEAYEKLITRQRIFMRELVLVSSPSMVKHVLVDRAENYHKGSVIVRALTPALGRGLLISDGDYWLRHRRTMNRIFRPQRMAAFASTIVTTTQELMERWARVAPSTPVEMADELTGLTLPIITRVMFSTEADTRIREILRAVPDFQMYARPHPFDLIGLPTWVPRINSPRANRALKAADTMDRAITEIIARRKAEPNGHDDLLSLLLEARDEESSLLMNAQEVRDEALTILIAGHDTTALALAWTLYLLALHPQEEQRLHEEVDRVVGAGAPNVEHLDQLKRTRMILEESMRLYPPGHTLSRLAVGEDEIDGQHIPAGTTVVVSPWVTHRHRKLWNNPDAFDPDRFSPEQVAARPKFQYIPFGGGPRICIGAQFAMMELLIILASIAQRFRLRLVPGSEIEPLGLVTLRPRNGLPMYIESRS